MVVLTYEPLVKIGIGPLMVSPHGLFTIAGFLISARYFLKATRIAGIADDVVTSILARAALGALVGARLFYVANHFSSYESPFEWLMIWEGGISLLGGITGGLVAAAPMVRRFRLRYLTLLDMAAPWLALGIAIGRIGDLVIADHLGGPTTFGLGFRCPEVVDVGRTVGSRCPPGDVVHLTAAYDLAVVLVIAGVIFAAGRRPIRWEGRLAALFGLLYGLSRFSLDFLREDVRRLGLTGSQWAALAIVSVCGLLFVRRSATAPRVSAAPHSTDDYGPGEAS